MSTILIQRWALPSLKEAGWKTDVAMNLGKAVGMNSPYIAYPLVQKSIVNDFQTGKVDGGTAAKIVGAQALDNGITQMDSGVIPNMLTRLGAWASRIKWRPSNLSIGSSLASGGIGAVAHTVNEMLPGGRASDDFLTRTNEGFWSRMQRAGRSTVIGGAAGAPMGGWGVIPGAIVGAAQEPIQGFRDASTQYDLASKATNNAVDTSLEMLSKHPHMADQVRGTISKLAPERVGEVGQVLQRGTNADAMRSSALVGAGLLGTGALVYGAKKLLEPPKKKPMNPMYPKIAKWVWQPDGGESQTPSTPAPAAPPAPQAQRPVPPQSSVSGMPTGAVRTGAGWTAPVNSQSGTRQVAFQPTGTQAMEMAIPGHATMTPAQRGAAVAKMPMPDNPRGREIANPNTTGYNASGMRNIDLGHSIGQEYNPTRDIARGTATPGQHGVPASANRGLYVPARWMPPGQAGNVGVAYATQSNAPLTTRGRIFDETGDVTKKIMAKTSPGLVAPKPAAPISAPKPTAPTVSMPRPSMNLGRVMPKTGAIKIARWSLG